MIDKFLRDLVNLLIYGGFFIGLCAACITAFTFELTGRTEHNFPYIIFIGVATAALYCCHRVVGLWKWSHASVTRHQHIYTSERFIVIRKYRHHIWFYCVVWIALTIWLYVPLHSLSMLVWLLPAGIITAAYVMPILPEGKRFRDLGWGKIVMIGWSWGWLTAFIPLWYYSEASLLLSIIHFVERMLFIILITIPFEIRDITVDRSLGLITLPEKIGKKKTMRVAILLCVLIFLTSAFSSFHYFNPAYTLSISLTSLLTLPIIRYSYLITDDYFFGGITDGLMILALWFFSLFSIWL